MDPVNQTNTTMPVATSTQWTPWTDANVIIAWAFGGTLPTPSVVSETMPAFSFDQDDFWGNAIPTPATPSHETIVDPFAWGISSTINNTTPADSNNIIQSTSEQPQEEILPEGTISLDSLETNTTTEEPVPVQPETVEKIEETVNITNEPNVLSDIQTTDTGNVNSFNADTLQSETIDSTEVNIENTIQDPTSNGTTTDISFDLPGQETSPATTEENISFDLPTTEPVKPVEIEFDLPEQPNTMTTVEEIVNTNNTSNEWDVTSVTPVAEAEDANNLNPNTTVNDNTLQSETINPTTDVTSDVITKDESDTVWDTISEENITEDDVVPVASVSESKSDESHELQDTYDEFKQSFTNYSSCKNNTTITLTGLRTDEDEVNYTFSHADDHNITVAKSNTTDILYFEETESGLKVTLNNDSIGYYGVEQVDTDTTHYLKEKLGKFTMMLESEHEREEKKQREWFKKIKESLRSF